MRRTLALVVHVAGLAGCGRIGFSGVAVTDGDSGDAANGDAGCVLGPWSAPVHLVGPSSSSTEFAPAYDPTGLVIVFASDRASNDMDLFVARRSDLDSPFGDAVRLAFSVALADDGGPAFEEPAHLLHWSTKTTQRVAPYLGDGMVGAETTESLPGDHPSYYAGGLAMFATRFSATGEVDLVHATRATTSSPWVVDDLAEVLNRPGLADGWASYDVATRTLYFERERESAPGTTESVFATRAADDAPFVRVTGTMSFGAPCTRCADPEVAIDGRRMIVAADLPDTSGGTDLYELTRGCL